MSVHELSLVAPDDTASAGSPEGSGVTPAEASAPSTPERETGGEPKPFRIIRPDNGWAALNVAEIWRFRDLFLTMAMRDIKVRYRQTMLGAVWVVLQPMMAAGVFTFLFGMIARLPKPDETIPFFVFSFAGLTAWGVFSNTLSRASGSLVGNAHLISKVAFPRLILPLATVAATLVDLAVALALAAVMLAVYGIYPGIAILLLPVWVVLLVLSGMGIGLLAAALMVTWRDIGYVTPTITQFLMYASPVVYTATAVNQAGLPDWVQAGFYLNPLAGLMEGFRWSLLGSTAGQASVGWTLYAAAWAVGLFGIGTAVFVRVERGFADVI